jgi:mono/diheme cytochrome c family protein
MNHEIGRLKARVVAVNVTTPYLGRRVEITEGILHCRRLRNATLWLKPICSDNAMMRWSPCCHKAVGRAQRRLPNLDEIGSGASAMQKAIHLALMSGTIVLGANEIARAAQPYTAKSIIAEHCIECHNVPGFIAVARNPEIGAPDFQAIADDRKTYTRERVTIFLRRPHFPMREFVLSESDIQKLIAFIEGLRGRPDVRQ